MTFEDFINLMKSFEGFRYYKYCCPAGFYTIGYGHLIKKGEDFDFITKDQAQDLLIQDIKISINLVIHVMKNTKLNQNQVFALTSFCYNLGIQALQRSALRQKILFGDFEAASLEFHKWVWANGKKLKGLIVRRSIESELFLA